MRIAVAGGTGLVGAMVVEAARAAGHDPVVLVRSTGVDLVTGRGLDEALAGADATIDVSNVRTALRRRSVAFFDAAGRRLLAAAGRAGVGHHVVLSIVGVDRVDLGYYAGKLRQEELVAAGGPPSTVLRATQFHEFAGQLTLGSLGPFVPVPIMRSQPVAAVEVAAQLVALAVAAPGGPMVEMAGPEIAMMPRLTRDLLRARGRRAVVVPIRVPGAAGRAMRGGGLLPGAGGLRGTITFAEWLEGERRTR